MAVSYTHLGTLFFQRYFLNDFFLEIVGNGIGHFRGDEAGSNGVARDFADVYKRQFGIRQVMKKRPNQS